MSEVFTKSFLVRSPTMDDVKAVTGPVVTCDIAEYGEADFTEGDLCSTWQAPGSSLAVLSSLLFSLLYPFVCRHDIMNGMFLHQKYYRAMQCREDLVHVCPGDTGIEYNRRWGNATNAATFAHSSCYPDTYGL
jgi:hypothetical protein